MKPNFIVIGAAKSGTTSLCSLLDRHPDIFVSDPKEINFFAYDELFSRGPQWYESFFDDAGDCAARGEGSPLYTIDSIYPQTASRIAAYGPDLKLVFIVRHPLERIESGWLELRAWGDKLVHADFNRAIKLNRDWLIESTMYWRQLSRYRQHFPDDQILVLFFEDFVADTVSALSRCHDFLGVDAPSVIDVTGGHLNSSSEKRVRRPMASAMSSAPGFRYVYQVARTLAPEFVRRGIREWMLNSSVSKRPIWIEESQRMVVEEIREDILQLLRYCDKSPAYWDLESPRC